MTMVTGICMVIVVAGAVLAVTVPNILHAIFGLGLSLLGIAGLFLTLGSPFVAAMQILIYVGGIAVAMVFAVMLSYAIGVKSEKTPGGVRWGAVLASGLFIAALAPVLLVTRFDQVAEPLAQVTPVRAIGLAMLQEYNVVFEVLSVVLLLAIVGAISIAMKEPNEG